MSKSYTSTTLHLPDGAVVLEGRVIESSILAEVVDTRIGCVTVFPATRSGYLTINAPAHVLRHIGKEFIATADRVDAELRDIWDREIKELANAMGIHDDEEEEA